MRILLVEPGKKPVLNEIDSSLKSMQEAVGGTIQALYPFKEPVALICNDEAKLLGLPLNRALRDKNGQIYDIVAGTFFLCGAPDGSDRFESLSQQEAEAFQQYFLCSESFWMVNGKVLCVRVDNRRDL